MDTVYLTPEQIEQIANDPIVVDGDEDTTEEVETVEIPEDVKALLTGFMPFEVLAADVDEDEEEDLRVLIERWTKYNRLDQTDKERGVLPVSLGGGLSLCAVQSPLDGAISIVMRRLAERIALSDGKTFNRYEIVALRPVDSAEEARKFTGTIYRSYMRRITSKVRVGFGATREERLAEAAKGGAAEAKASKLLKGGKAKS